MSSFEFVSIKNLDSLSIFSASLKASVLDSALFAFRQPSGAAAISSAGIEDGIVITSDWLLKISQPARRNVIVCSAPRASAYSVFGLSIDIELDRNSKTAQQDSQP